MEENFSIGEFIAGIVYLAVAARLFRRGLRNGEVAERLLAGAFFFYGVSSVVYAMATLPRYESMSTALDFVGRIVYCPTAVMMVMFTRRVFRKEESWATWLVWASPILLAVGIGGSVLFRGDWEGFSTSSPWFWLEWLGFTYPFAWAGTEAFVQYGQARRRVQLGLCAPLVCNRFLLWALFGTLQVCAFLVLFPQYANYETENVFTVMWDVVYGGFLIGSIIMVWLVFFAPAFYKRWIGGRALAANTLKA